MNLDFERGRAAERNRFNAILGAPEAKGQCLPLAVHLALSTDMSAADAVAALRAAQPKSYSPDELAARINGRTGTADLSADWQDTVVKINRERGF